MAKGQTRSNREVRKPKKEKAASVMPSTLSKGASASVAVAKKPKR